MAQQLTSTATKLSPLLNIQSARVNEVAAALVDRTAVAAVADVIAVSAGKPRRATSRPFMYTTAPSTAVSCSVPEYLSKAHTQAHVVSISSAVKYDTASCVDSLRKSV